MTTFNSQTDCVDGVNVISIVAVKGTDLGVSKVTLTVGTAPSFDLPSISAGQTVYQMKDHANTSDGFVHVHGEYFDLNGAPRNTSDQDVPVADITNCVVTTTTEKPTTTTAAPTTTTTAAPTTTTSTTTTTRPPTTTTAAPTTTTSTTTTTTTSTTTTTIPCAATALSPTSKPKDSSFTWTVTVNSSCSGVGMEIVFTKGSTTKGPLTLSSSGTSRTVNGNTNNWSTGTWTATVRKSGGGSTLGTFSVSVT
jgi:hypothetical protein